MATLLDKGLSSLKRETALFAELNIACRQELSASTDFPWDIWRKMGEEGLLGLGLPHKYGGLGGNYLSIAIAEESLVHKGHNMGIALSWLMHNVISRFLILGFGNQGQREMYLENLARGKATASLALSERGTGAHPKHLETSAHRQGESWVLKGEKAYLTNGPIADLYIVIAVTGHREGRKDFSAFLMPRDTPGLTTVEGVDMRFLRPAPHGHRARARRPEGGARLLRSRLLHRGAARLPGRRRRPQPVDEPRGLRLRGGRVPAHGLGPSAEPSRGQRFREDLRSPHLPRCHLDVRAEPRGLLRLRAEVPSAL